jgi:hypothetical protein
MPDFPNVSLSIAGTNKAENSQTMLPCFEINLLSRQNIDIMKLLFSAFFIAGSNNSNSETLDNASLQRLIRTFADCLRTTLQ